MRKAKNAPTHSLISSTHGELQIALYRKIAQELKQLRNQAIERKKALDYKHCWISHAGKLCMKKSDDSRVITISCCEDLLELKISISSI